MIKWITKRKIKVSYSNQSRTLNKHAKKSISMSVRRTPCVDEKSVKANITRDNGNPIAPFLPDFEHDELRKKSRKISNMWCRPKFNKKTDRQKDITVVGGGFSVRRESSEGPKLFYKKFEAKKEWEGPLETDFLLCKILKF